VEAGTYWRLLVWMRLWVPLRAGAEAHAPMPPGLSRLPPSALVWDLAAVADSWLLWMTAGCCG